MKNRVLFLYIIAAIIPLMLMDVAAVGVIVRYEKREKIHEMENAASLSVPLTVDMNSGNNWYVLK